MLSNTRHFCISLLFSFVLAGCGTGYETWVQIETPDSQDSRAESPNSIPTPEAPTLPTLPILPILPMRDERAMIATQAEAEAWVKAHQNEQDSLRVFACNRFAQMKPMGTSEYYEQKVTPPPAHSDDRFCRASGHRASAAIIRNETLRKNCFMLKPTLPSNDAFLCDTAKFETAPPAQ